MSITSRRRAKLIGGALFAASLAAGSFATTPVSADIGDTGVGAFIRVQPTNPLADWENQPAPVIMAGATSAAAPVQLLIPNDWESGDKITLQVQADNNANANGHDTNCLSAAQSISFAGPYSAADVAVAGPWNANAAPPGGAWGEDQDPDFDPASDETGLYMVDPRSPGAATSVPAPTFNVALTISPSCGGVGVTDQIELTFSNSAVAPSGSDYYQLTFSNIRYNVGALVPTGPVHVIPFARQAVDASPGTFIDENIFGGNLYSAATGLRWTNNAFISPVTIAATGTNIVADGSTQPLGSITLTERAADALLAGNHYVCIPGVTLVSAGTATITGGTSPTVTASTVSGSCIALTLGGTINGAINVITITGITGSTGAPGTLLAALSILSDPDGGGPLTASAGNWMNYLTPDDQYQGSVNSDWSNDLYYSDVNSAVGTVGAFFAMAVGLPDRIGGNDRYETSSKIAANLTLDGPGTCTQVAVITSGTSYADALSANFLAGALSDRAMGQYDVPVLLVTGDTLPQTTAQYLNWAGVGHVYIVGGTAAVSSGIEAQLANTLATDCAYAETWVNNQKIQVTRVAGADRYATNRAAANLGADIWGWNGDWGLQNRVQLELLGPGKRTAIVATGTGFADALAAGPVAYGGMPLILTDGASLSASALGSLQDLDIEQVIIIGGTAAVSDAVRTQISGLGILTGRVGGANRYATAAAWATFVDSGCPAAATAGEFDCGLDWGYDHEAVFLASGTNFADALSGGPLAWDWDAPIVLTNPATLSPETAAWLTANAALYNQVVVLGLGQAVSTAAMNAASAAISVA